jgi:Flp pilus assembly protein TadG
MVVPLLCLIIIAILHFGKVMNYWLDLNHVASEGAR